MSDAPPAYSEAVGSTSRVQSTAQAPVQGDATSACCPTGEPHSWLPPYYPKSAWCMAIGLFPFGILCCLKMKESRCERCGAELTLGEGEEDPAKQAERDRAYRLGFAIGAATQVIQSGVVHGQRN
ncbi:hypothetical protein BC832DRAFT_591306 [Gaertneriomyces semiglobifer]|nr:hypothetical protein BC832DRAFT_591306 [Gaertneriomyces semiglobifer]